MTHYLLGALVSVVVALVWLLRRKRAEALWELRDAINCAWNAGYVAGEQGADQGPAWLDYQARREREA